MYIYAYPPQKLSLLTDTHVHIHTYAHTIPGLAGSELTVPMLCSALEHTGVWSMAEQHWHCTKAPSSPTEPTGCSGQELGSGHPEDGQPELRTGPAHTWQCHPAIKAGKRGRRKEAPVMKASDLLQNCCACWGTQSNIAHWWEIENKHFLFLLPHGPSLFSFPSFHFN